VDDITLGQRMKALAGGYRVVLARDAQTIRMYGSLGQAVCGFSKNIYAFLGFNPVRALMGLLAGWLIHIVPPAILLAAPWVPPSLLLPAGIAAGTELVLDAAMCLWAGYPLWIAPLYPLRALLWNVTLVRSAWMYYRHGVVWRGRVYKDGANEATSQRGNEG
jgi:chlorobactene glucosyltransferase